MIDSILSNLDGLRQSQTADGKERFAAVIAEQIRLICDERDEYRARAEAAEATLQAATDFHPRAMKLIGKRKPFLVVANDESYYQQVYDLIRDHEMLAGTWTPSDQMRYESALAALKGGEK